VTTAEWALGVSILSLLVASATFIFNASKEYYRGKRLKVQIAENSSTLVVSAHNAGNTPVTVVDWGLLMSTGGQRWRLVPSETGVRGPDLPVTLSGSELLPPLSVDWQAVRASAQQQIGAGGGVVKVRGYVTGDGGKRKHSSRRTAVDLRL
jgi:hypothetical protein